MSKREQAARDPRDLVLQLTERGLSLSGYERDGIFLNVGGKKFVDISGVTGLDSISDGRGAVYADFDNDGDPDVFLPAVQGEAHLLFRNEIGQKNGWIRVSLIGSASGRDAYGATVRVKTSQGIQTKIKSGGEGFLSQHDPRLLFGLGDDAAAEWIEVRWPSGKLQHVDGPIAARTHLTLNEATLTAAITNTPRSAQLGGTAAPETASTARADGGALVLTGETADGHPSRVAIQRRTLVVLWATWCTMCREDLATIVRSREALARQGYDIVAVSIDDDASVFRSFMAAHPLPLRTIRLSSPSRKALFGKREVAVPAALTTDAHGKADRWLVGRPAVLRFVNLSTFAEARTRRQR